MAMIGNGVKYAQQLLEQGKLVAIPTETVYGLAANALNEDAVLSIFEVKNRPQFDPLIIHTDSIEKLQHFVTSFPEKALKLATAFMPGPLTLLLPKNNIIPDLVTSGLESVAVRIPKHPLALELLATLDFPLAAPSANPFGYISPTTAAHVQAQLGDKIAYILDGGECSVGIESTIVGFDDEQPVVYRLGGIAVEEIENIVGVVKTMAHSTSNPQAPGMLKSHYAPRKPLTINNLEELLKNYDSQKIGVLSFDKTIPEVPVANQRILSPTRNFSEAAKNLFAYLRQLDALDVAVIYAELLPNQNLGRAINDRLRRAAA